MTMRKKDYEAIARAINQSSQEVSDSIVAAQAYELDYRSGWYAALASVRLRIADYCATQDPTFKRDRFLAACGVSHE